MSNAKKVKDMLDRYPGSYQIVDDATFDKQYE
jgi:hypothetical protein